MPEPTVAEQIAQWATALAPRALPAEVTHTAGRVLLDVAGNCLAARNEDYVRSLLAAWDGTGPCTALGHEGGLDAAGAAVVNGASAHGEDYDDTFEGSPVHAGCVVVPAVLAACENAGRGGSAALAGIVAGLETTCRLTLVAPTAIHRAGFHPTAVLGVMGATVGVARALSVQPATLVSALGIAGSMASGIIEYLAEGTWTKRLHPGWAAQSALRAVSMAQQGFTGPRTVFEGTHGLFNGFAVTEIPRDFGQLTDGLGTQWLMQRIAFKPYPCGTMIQPYIDCAVALRGRGIAVDEIETVRCETAEGIVHRLWEPLTEKHRPSTPYSAKFSIPYCVAIGLREGKAGLADFTPRKITDPALLELASRVRYVIDPDNAYPHNYTGHVALRLRDGSVHEARQPHLRGGMHDPLPREELERKFRENVLFGGGSAECADELQQLFGTLFEQPSLTALGNCRTLR